MMPIWRLSHVAHAGCKVDFKGWIIGQTCAWLVSAGATLGALVLDATVDLAVDAALHDPT